MTHEARPSSDSWCLGATTAAAAYVAGELTAVEEARMERHVDCCAPCRRHLSELARIEVSETGASGNHEAGATRSATADESSGYTLAQGARVGRYVVDGPIGMGAMGAVYAAHDPQLRRRVALKRVRGDFSEGAQNRLLREAQAMVRLSHPNVVTVHDLVIVGEQIFIAMEYVWISLWESTGLLEPLQPPVGVSGARASS